MNENMHCADGLTITCHKGSCGEWAVVVPDHDVKRGWCAEHAGEALVEAQQAIHEYAKLIVRLTRERDELTDVARARDETVPEDHNCVL